MKQLFLLLAFLLAFADETAAQIKLLQNTAVPVAVGPFVDPTDGTAETGLTISQADVRLKKNSADWAQKNDTNACTHEENGWYECALNTTDTNTTGILVLSVNESGALPVWIYFEVIPTASYDLLITGNVASGADIWNTAEASVTAGIGLKVKTNLDAPVSYAGGILTSGSAQAGGTNTITLATTAPTVDLSKKRISLLGGVGAFQSGIITAYDTGTKVATVQDSSTGGNWGVTPSSGTVYVVHDASAGALVDNILSAAKVAADTIGASELAADASPEIADAVWDEAIAGHLGAGSTGASLNAAGSAGDPWATALPGAYGAGTAGKIIGDRIMSSVTGSVGSIATGGITAASIATDAFTASKFAADSGNEFATSLLDLSNGVESNFTVRQIMRAIAAILAGKSSGFDTNTPTFRDLNDTKNRVISTTNATGRTSITFDLN